MRLTAEIDIDDEQWRNADADARHKTQGRTDGAELTAMIIEDALQKEGIYSAVVRLTEDGRVVCRN